MSPNLVLSHEYGLCRAIVVRRTVVTRENRRLYQHHQFEWSKPSPSNIKNSTLVIGKEWGINPLEHDIRFVEDNWENPSTGSAGLGWKFGLTVWFYFQQVGLQLAQ